ncbi:MAG TPA: hypothetical protein VJL81_12840 [Solirubrobacterales bacterium]|nr:hypothetical protein [Solirubrobacterales bacterium]
MADLQSLLDATAARERIWAIPGVRRIGFGLKETAGEVQPRWVFRVYVEAKRPAAELQAEELIPAEVEGFETDVLVDHESRPQCGPRLYPGLEISVYVPNSATGSGTLGCLVQKGGKFSMLTCQHVIAFGMGSENVYQPSRSECCGFECSDPVGKTGEMHREVVTREGKSFFVDCGLAPLVNKVSFENELHQGVLDAHIRDLSTEPLVPGTAAGAQGLATALTITKEGAKTGLTTGTVVEVCAEERFQSGPPLILWRLISKLVESSASLSITYDVAADEPLSIAEIMQRFQGEAVSATQPDPGGHPRRIHFEGKVFSVPGDSGSIWYDAAKHAVGLHNGGRVVQFKADGHGQVEVLTGRGEACHIAAVFSVLGLDPNTGIVVGAKTSAGPIVHVPATVPPTPLAIERELTRSEAGRALLVDVRRSQVEVRRLIEQRRRVTLVWHRHKGPAFVAAATNLGREGYTEIPQEVAGARAADLVRAMLDVLAREGSPELREIVEGRRELLTWLVENCGDLEEVVAHLEQEPSGVA